jgi:uncharacterized protein (TIGR00297 family)
LVLSLVPAAVGVVATILLAAGAVAAHALTARAGAVAAACGSVIVVFAGYPYVSLLILFVVGSVLATRYRMDEKRRKNVQEGTAGERGVANVVAHSVIPVVIAVVAGWGALGVSTSTLALLYVSALAFGASDTFASELGVLSNRTRSIVTARPVAAGTNGGISALGEGFAFAGAASTALLALGVFALFGPRFPSAPLLFVVATIAGFIGCQVDSVLGELLENRGFLTKHTTNLLSMLFSVGLAAALLAVLGGAL